MTSTMAILRLGTKYSWQIHLIFHHMHVLEKKEADMKDIMAREDLLTKKVSSFGATSGEILEASVVSRCHETRVQRSFPTSCSGFASRNMSCVLALLGSRSSWLDRVSQINVQMVQYTDAKRDYLDSIGSFGFNLSLKDH